MLSSRAGVLAQAHQQHQTRLPLAPASPRQLRAPVRPPAAARTRFVLSWSYWITTDDAVRPIGGTPS